MVPSCRRLYETSLFLGSGAFEAQPAHHLHTQRWQGPLCGCDAQLQLLGGPQVIAEPTVLDVGELIARLIQ